MAEFKKIPRQFLSTKGTPDIAKLGKAKAEYSETIGKIASSTSKQIGEMVSNRLKAEKNSLQSSAIVEHQKLYNAYKSDPNLDADLHEQFSKSLNAINEGFLKNAHSSYRDSLSKELENQAIKYDLKIGAKVHKLGIERDNDQFFNTYDNYTNLMTQAFEVEDVQAANDYKAKALEAIEGYGVTGGTKKQVAKLKDQLDIDYLSGIAIAKIKAANWVEEIDEVMTGLALAPNNEINNQVFAKTNAYLNPRKPIIEEALSLKRIFYYSETGDSYKNFNENTKISNAAVNTASKRMVLGRENAFGNYINESLISAMPERDSSVNGIPVTLMPDAESNYTHSELLEFGLFQTMKNVPEGEPTLQDIAAATLFVGSENSTVLNDKAIPMLMEGSGEQADEAFNALNLVETVDSNFFNLTPEQKALYTDYKIRKENIGGDPNVLIEQSRKAVLNKTENDIRHAQDTFKSKYGSNAAAALKNKEFKSVLKQAGLGESDMSLEAQKDFYDMLKINYVAAKSNLNTALQSTKSEMSRVHGRDKFNKIVSGSVGRSVLSNIVPGISDVGSFSTPNFEYTRDSLTKLHPNLPSDAITNQVLMQTVNFAENNKNLRIQESYNRVKEANDIQLVENNLAFNAPDWSSEHLSADPGIYAEYDYKGQIVRGRLFTRGNELTRNNRFGEGTTVHEVWMQTTGGLEIPILDENGESVFQVSIKNLNQFVPEYAQNLTDEKINEMVDKYLMREAGELYGNPIVTNPPVEFARVQAQKKAYLENKEARQKAEKLIKQGIEINNKLERSGISPEDMLRQTEGDLNQPQMTEGDVLAPLEIRTSEEKPKDETPQFTPVNLDEQMTPSEIGDVKELRKEMMQETPKPKSKREVALASIEKASEVTGVPEDWLIRIAKKESNLNNDATPGTSSATGLFQFTTGSKGTWKLMVDKYGEEYGITLDMVKDPLANSIMGAKLLQDNGAILKRALRRDPNLEEIYLAHFAGVGKAINVLRLYDKEPNAPTSRVFTQKEINANERLLKGTTIKQFLQKLMDGLNG